MISVVIPAYDEATALGWLLPRLPVRLHGRTVRPLVVNDGSTDGTEAELRALMAERLWLRQVRHTQSCGQSAALRSGGMAARAPLVTREIAAAVRPVGSAGLRSRRCGRSHPVKEDGQRAMAEFLAPLTGHRFLADRRE